MAGPPLTPAQSASRTIGACFWLGLLAVVVGTIVAGAAWPGEEATLNGVEDTGSPVGVVIGMLLAGLGSFGVLVAVVAWGVKLGTQSAGESHAA
jgi:hypothetical protein